MSTYPRLTTEPTLGDFHLDCTGRVRAATLCDLLQAAATTHAEKLGVGMPALREQGVTWMLARLDIVFANWPARQSALTLATWPSGVRGHVVCCRDFDMRDASGRAILRATSEWVTVNFETRRLARLSPALMTLAPPDAPRVDIDPMPDLEGAAFAPSGECRIPVRRADLDVNRHVNNVHYVEWLLEPLSDAAYGRVLRRLSISYHAEALAGDEVTSRVSEALLPDGGVATAHTLCRGDTLLTKATCLWTNP